MTLVIQYVTNCYKMQSFTTFAICLDFIENIFIKWDLCSNEIICYYVYYVITFQHVVTLDLLSGTGVLIRKHNIPLATQHTSWELYLVLQYNWLY